MSAELIELPDALGLARPEPERLKQIVAAAIGADPQAIRAVTDVAVEKVDYEIGTPMTHALLRCRGTAILDGDVHTSWSAFVKVLQSPWEWEHINRIPEQFRADFADNVPWRGELNAYNPAIGAVLPDGMRQPRLYGVVEIDDTHVAMWVEDIVVSAAGWNVARFAHAAELLGRLAGRRPIGTDAVLIPGSEWQVPGLGLRFYAGGRVKMGALPMLADDATWRHPVVSAAIEAAGEQALRDDLVRAGHHIDAWLDLLDTLPQTYCHGDASPQNLLVPAAEPDEFVVIDWSFHGPHVVGFDLGQLLIGLAHAGELSTNVLPEILAAILPAYHHGLADEGFVATLEKVRTGFLVSLAVRSMFTALPIEALAETPSSAQMDYWVKRIRLTRFMLDLAGEFGRRSGGPLTWPP